MLTATLTLVLLTATAGQNYESNMDDSSYDSGSSVESNAIRGRGMPQTCYSPRYGCYPGNERFLHRYPAYHGTYYRRPYNYRNLFDYPWHAELHEPTSMFSYNVPAPEEVRPVAPTPPRDSTSRNSGNSFKPIQPVSDSR